ncbi:MAG TPA: hypothetical protein VKV23_01350 [Acidimicrobiales bacterium]|nr:hypothetical protein [Acidimicrobiales bacterium]
MRVLVNVEIATPEGNEMIRSGRMTPALQKMLAQLQPEAAYFYPRNGRRAMTLVVDAPEAAGLPSLVEPFWLELGAAVEVLPCMTAEEVAAGIERLA